MFIHILIGEKDIKTALILLQGVAHKWKLIGVYLRVRSPRLDDIEVEYADPQTRLMETIKSWLQGNTYEDSWQRPTWSQLAEAVDQVNNKAIAQNIRKMHGKF